MYIKIKQISQNSLTKNYEKSDEIQKSYFLKQEWISQKEQHDDSVLY